MWERGLRSTVGTLRDAGIPVIVVHPVPKFPGWDLRACAAGRVAIDDFSCGRSTSREQADAERADADAAERRAIADIQGVIDLDLSDVLCGGGTCATSKGSTWLYHDGDHLSIDGAKRTQPVFARAIRHALGAGAAS